MNTNIRKDSKVTARTGNNVVVLGTVTSVKGQEVTLLTSNNVVHVVNKTTTTKVSAVEFKRLVQESTQPKVEFKVNDTKKPNKKSAAREIYAQAVGTKSRKEIIGQFMEEIGLSVNGASTYYQNFKSGKWGS